MRNDLENRSKDYTWVTPSRESPSRKWKRNSNFGNFVVEAEWDSGNHLDSWTPAERRKRSSDFLHSILWLVGGFFCGIDCISDKGRRESRQETFEDWVVLVGSSKIWEDIPARDLFSHPTVKNLVDHLESWKSSCERKTNVRVRVKNNHDSHQREVNVDSTELMKRKWEISSLNWRKRAEQQPFCPYRIYRTFSNLNCNLFQHLRNSFWMYIL